MKKYFLFVLIAMFSVSAGCKKQDVSWDGKILFFTGNVLINDQQAVIEQIIKPGEEIVTSTGSVCDIIFNEKNIIRIAENSSVVLNLSDEEKNLELKQGAVTNVLKKLIRTDKDIFKVITPAAVAAIRGTSFFVKIENQNATYICDCNGVLEVSDLRGEKSQTLEASHHKAVRISKNGSGFIISEAKMLYHDDAGMQALADKIKVKIDWSVIDKNN